MTAEQQLIEGAKKEGEVVFWTTTWDPGDVLKLFAAKYPFLKVKTWDSRGPEMSARLAEEAKAGRFTVDVLSMVENDVVGINAKEMFLDYEWPNVKGWPYQPPHGYYVNFRSSLKGPAYSPLLVTPAEVAKGWETIKDPKWRGKTVASLSANELPLVLALQWGENGKLNWEKSEAFWEEVARNTKPLMTTGYDIGIGGLASGEFSIFTATALSTLMKMKWRGGPVEVVPVEQFVAGAGSLAIAKNAPHPNAAKLWADFITSPEGLVPYADANGMVVFDPEGAKKAKVNVYLASRGIKWGILSTQLMIEHASRSDRFWNKLLRGG